MALKHTFDSTPIPEAPISLPIPKITDAQWSQLGQTCSILLDINLGNRQAYDNGLDVANAMYEQRLAPRDNPWRQAANFCVPLVSSETDELTARLAGTIIQPRLITVRGNDPAAVQQAHLVEQFLNSQFADKWNAPREEADADDICTTAIHLAARDGTSYGEVMWELSTHERVYNVEEPQLDPDGQPVMDENGEPVKQRVTKRVKFIDYDDVRWTVRESRDVVILPNFAPSISQADGVAVKIYMNEWDIDKMVNSDIFDKDVAERVLAYVSDAQGELSYDQQGYATYTIGGRINVVDTAVAGPEDMKMTRGPVQVWRILTNQFDLDGDGVPEENFIWIHWRSRLMLGFAPFEYERGRNIFPLRLWPRPNRIYGFGVADRIGSMQNEANAIHNGRLDMLDNVVDPLSYQLDNVRIEEGDAKFGSQTRLKMTNKDDFGFIQYPEPPSTTIQEEQLILQYIAKTMSSPQAAALSTAATGGKMSRRQQEVQAQVQGMQNSLMFTRVRRWILAMVKYSIGLTLQYGKSQLEAVSHQPDGSSTPIQIPRELLGQNFTYGISGMGGILDKEGRRQDMMSLYQLGMGSPIIQQDPVKMYTLLRLLFETFDIPEVTALLGTAQEAQQRAEMAAQAAQAQEQKEFIKDLISHGKFTGSNAASGQQPKQQPQQQ